MRTEELLKNSQERYLEKLKEEYGINDEIGFYSKTTGEVYDVENGITLKHPTLKRKNKQNETLISNFKKKELFVKVYKTPIEILGKELSNRDFAWFMRLIPYVNMQDCVLYDSNGEYLNVRKLSSLLEVNYDNLQSVIKSYEKNGLVAKIKRPSQKDIYKEVTAICVNPYVLMNGECLIELVNNVFKGTRWAKL